MDSFDVLNISRSSLRMKRKRRGGALYKYPKNLGGDMKKMKKKEMKKVLPAILAVVLVLGAGLAVKK